MNRTQLQQLSEERIADARALLGAGQWSGAYYLAGYALELALKSCILVHIEQTGVIFEKRHCAEKCWTHDVEQLVKQAGLSDKRDNAVSTNPKFDLNWVAVKDWSESSRYRLSTQFQAEKLFDALTNTNDGVLSWVKNFW